MHIFLLILLLVAILFFLVLIHEYGHYITAKWFKIRVDEFGIGYPPRAAKLFKRGETIFTLNWLPFGGFVKIFGENPNETSGDVEEDKRSFVAKPKYKQAIVLFAGIFMNFLCAWLLFLVTFLSGSPTSIIDGDYPDRVQNAHLTIIGIEPKSPAEIAGLTIADQILSVKTETDTLANPTIETVIDFVKTHGTNELTVTYDRQGTISETKLVPKQGIISDRPAIGISMDMIGTLKLPVHLALLEGLKKTGTTVWQILSYLGNLIHDSVYGQKVDLSGVAGPVGIVGILGQVAQFGFIYLLLFIASISANLAIINLLPFPALDGGRLLFVAIEAITRRKIPAKVFNTVNAVGFFILIGLMLLVTYHDIAKIVMH